MKKSKIDLFKDKDYVKFENYISKFDVNILDEATRDIHLNLNESHDDFIKDPGTEGFINLPAHSKHSLKIINKIITDPKVFSFLEKIIGTNFKLWDISYRVSKPGDKGLYLHQDGPGQFNMAILLNDNNSKNGNTAFLPSSHLIVKSQKSLKLEIPPFIINMFSFLFKSLYGNKGDAFFFSRRVWHGGFANKSEENNRLIFVAFSQKATVI